MAPKKKNLQLQGRNPQPATPFTPAETRSGTAHTTHLFLRDLHEYDGKLGETRVTLRKTPPSNLNEHAIARAKAKKVWSGNNPEVALLPRSLEGTAQRTTNDNIAMPTSSHGALAEALARNPSTPNANQVLGQGEDSEALRPALSLPSNVIGRPSSDEWHDATKDEPPKNNHDILNDDDPMEDFVTLFGSIILRMVSGFTIPAHVTKDVARILGSHLSPGDHVTLGQIVYTPGPGCVAPIFYPEFLRLLRKVAHGIRSDLVPAEIHPEIPCYIATDFFKQGFPNFGDVAKSFGKSLRNYGDSRKEHEVIDHIHHHNALFTLFLFAFAGHLPEVPGKDVDQIREELSQAWEVHCDSPYFEDTLLIFEAVYPSSYTMLSGNPLNGHPLTMGFGKHLEFHNGFAESPLTPNAVCTYGLMDMMVEVGLRTFPYALYDPRLSILYTRLSSNSSSFAGVKSPVFKPVLQVSDLMEALWNSREKHDFDILDRDLSARHTSFGLIVPPVGFPLEILYYFLPLYTYPADFKWNVVYSQEDVPIPPVLGHHIPYSPNVIATLAFVKVDPTRVDATQVDPTQVDQTQVDPTRVDASKRTTEKVHSMYASRMLTGEDARKLVEEHLVKADNDFLVVHLSTASIQQNSLQFENNLEVLAGEVGDMDGNFVKQGIVLGKEPGHPEPIGAGFTKDKVLDWYCGQEVLLDAGSTLKKGQYQTAWDLVKLWRECALSGPTPLLYITGEEIITKSPPSIFPGALTQMKVEDEDDVNSTVFRVSEGNPQQGTSITDIVLAMSDTLSAAPTGLTSVLAGELIMMCQGGLPLHTEDLDLGAVNFNKGPGTKAWIAFPADQRVRLGEWLVEKCKELNPTTKQPGATVFTKNFPYIPTDEELADFKAYAFLQPPYSYVFTAKTLIHTVVSDGVTISEASNMFVNTSGNSDLSAINEMANGFFKWTSEVYRLSRACERTSRAKQTLEVIKVMMTENKDILMDLAKRQDRLMVQQKDAKEAAQAGSALSVPKTQNTDGKVDQSMLDQVVDICADVPSNVAAAKTVNETLVFAKVVIKLSKLDISVRGLKSLPSTDVFLKSYPKSTSDDYIPCKSVLTSFYDKARAAAQALVIAKKLIDKTLELPPALNGNVNRASHDMKQFLSANGKVKSQ
ncbi:hypothetical protein CYMTET_39551 [Cymbomonas tetramitiformis]|uniref:JmjC domain-containing protein n=1 Tax=Cymbomonas tetramitiformis TaxID=36881 RepID=A0AAE0F5H0_9CHLO|nr:hypothetical protein CYMTET_39551 [Cymbomonas tetramitiformis]